MSNEAEIEKWNLEWLKNRLESKIIAEGLSVPDMDTAEKFMIEKIEEQEIDIEAISQELKALDETIKVTDETIAGFCDELKISTPF